MEIRLAETVSKYQRMCAFLRACLQLCIFMRFYYHFESINIAYCEILFALRHRTAVSARAYYTTDNFMLLKPAHPFIGNVSVSVTEFYRRLAQPYAWGFAKFWHFGALSLGLEWGGVGEFEFV